MILGILCPSLIPHTIEGRKLVEESMLESNQPEKLEILEIPYQ